MYAVITKKDSSDIVMVWLSDKVELTDGALVCQNEGTVTTFEDITSLTHEVSEFEGELPSDYSAESYSFSNGAFVKK